MWWGVRQASEKQASLPLAPAPPLLKPRPPTPYLDVLELGERRPKGVAALSVFHSAIQGGLGNAQGLGGDANAAHVQGLLWGPPSQ